MRSLFDRAVTAGAMLWCLGVGAGAQEIHGDVEWANGGGTVATQAKAQDQDQEKVEDTEPTSVEADRPTAKYRGAIPVEVRRTDEGWRLFRGGEVYTLKGGSAKPGELEYMAKAGGNSIRTWGTEDLEPLLDEAHENGITVCVGIWLGHEKHGFDYSNEQRKAEQMDMALDAVRRYKDHPAVLLWAVGNEMELDSRGRNEKVFQHVNDIAKAIKQIDPDHPTMTVLAGTAGKRLPNFVRWCPDIDILGPNIYGEDLSGIGQRLRDAGIERPYIIPEYGPQGQWGMAKTPWSAPHEPSTTQKAQQYLQHYAKPMNTPDGYGLGGYVFYFKYNDYDGQGRPWPSWYSMHHHTGEAYGGADAMTFSWTGRWPDNLAPEIQFLDCDADSRFTFPGEVYEARALYFDRDNDPLQVEWFLARDHESGERFAMIDPEEWLLEQGDGTLKFKIPETEPGGFRLHLVIKDGQGKAARANIPLFITPTKPEDQG